MTYLILTARYEKVRGGGALVLAAVLTAIGMTPDGKRCVLSCSVARSEAEHHWREFLRSLQERRKHGPESLGSRAQSLNADRGG